MERKKQEKREWGKTSREGALVEGRNGKEEKGGEGREGSQNEEGRKEGGRES